MKKHSLLVVLMAALAITGCVVADHTSEMEGFTGTNVEVGDNGAQKGLKMLVLNEGPFMGLSTLDLLDLSNKKFYADVFGQANPEVEQGLGSTGNDIEITAGRIWLAMNASNMILGLNQHTFRLEVEIEMESPRSIISDDDYLYVSSYGSAMYGSDHPVKGLVHRINLKNPAEYTSLDVGYQPEGMAILDGQLYVANSGGYNAKKDNTVTVINTKDFKKTQVLELPVSNLNMMRKAHNELWVSTYSTWDASYAITAPSALAVFTKDGNASVIDGVHADKITECDGIIYAVGNNEEMSYGSDYCLYKVDAATRKVTTTHFKGTDLERIAYPYCIVVNPLTGDIIIADAKDFIKDSQLHCFTKDLKHKWTVTTGVGTGHLLIYQI